MLGLGYYNGVRVFSRSRSRSSRRRQSPARSAHPARPGVGHRFALFRQPRRIVSHPLLRTRIHRHSLWIDPFPRLRDSAGQQRASAPPSPHHRLARPRCHAGRGGGGHPGSGVTLTGYNETLAGAGLHRVVARNASVLTGSTPWPKSASPRCALPRGPDHQPNRPGSQCPAQRRSHARGGRTPGRPVLSRAGLSGAEDREDIANTKDPAPGSPSGASTRRPTAAPRHRCCARSMPWSSTSRTLAPALHLLDHHGVCPGSGRPRRIPFFVLDRPNPSPVSA